MSPRLITTLDVETPSFLLLGAKRPTNVRMRRERKVSRLRPEAIGKKASGTGYSNGEEMLETRNGMRCIGRLGLLKLSVAMRTRQRGPEP